MEEENHISPCGGGKTQLNGMFANAGQVLSSAADRGASYWDAESVFEAFQQSSGLTATSSICTYVPDRSNRFYGKLRDASTESILMTTLNHQDMSLIARQHSDYGSGKVIKHTNIFIFPNDKDAKQKIPAKKAPQGAVAFSRDIGSLVLEFYGVDESAVELRRMLQEIGFPLVGIVGTGLALLIPKCMDINGASRNPKERLPSIKAPGGEGANHPIQRQKRRLGRKEAKKQRHVQDVASLRCAKRIAGIHLCPMKCPTTQRYCRTEFLNPKSLDKHLCQGNHDFPKGIDANTVAVLVASKPGGVLAAGSRPNARSSLPFVTIEEAPVNTPGIEDAVCFGKCNRKESDSTTSYHKPARLVKALKELYEIGQDGLLPKLKPFEIRQKLANMRDPADGGLMFCYSKRGSWPRKLLCQLCNRNPCDCNGMLPPLWMVMQWMNSETQKKKKSPETSN